MVHQLGFEILKCINKSIDIGWDVIERLCTLGSELSALCAGPR